jgi:acyl dehydratase
MAVPARTPLPELAKGHEFPRTSFELSEQDACTYLEAVGDSNPVYLDRKLAPPLAVAASALGALLDVIELPAGALHTGQEMEAHQGVPFGATLTLAGRIAQRSERAGLIISVIEFEVTPSGSDSAAVTGRTTVMTPAAATSGGEA